MGGVGTEWAFSYTSCPPDALNSIPITAMIIKMQLMLNVTFWMVREDTSLFLEGARIQKHIWIIQLKMNVLSPCTKLPVLQTGTKCTKTVCYLN